MTIIAKNETPPQAPAGQHVAVCCDVADLGVVKTTYNNEEKHQHKIRVWFQIAELDGQGKRFLVSRRLTLSMHKKAALRAFLESWRGKPYGEDDARNGIDVELMVGVPALVQTVENDRGYTDITSIMRLPKGMEAIAVEGFERFKDRATEGRDETGAMHDYDGVEGEDDDLPF